MCNYLHSIHLHTTFIMNPFDYFWQMLEGHGVVERHKTDAAILWDKFSLTQQRYIFRTIRDKIQQGKFVNYNPVLAIKENAPKAPKIQIMSSEDYYRIHHTQANLDGWVRTFLPEQQKTIYIKQN